MTHDCAKELTEKWIKSKDDPDNHSLRGTEVKLVKKVLKMEMSDVANDLWKIMEFHSLDYFLQVRAQIRSLDIFWSRIIMAKKYIDTELAKGEQDAFIKINAHDCLFGLALIPKRVNIGLNNVSAEVLAEEAEELQALEEEEDEHKRGRKAQRSLGSNSTEESRPRWPRTRDKKLRKFEPATTEDSDASSSDEPLLEKGKRRRRKNVTKNIASSKSKKGKRRGRTNDTTEDSASSSEEDEPPSKKGRRRGGKNATTEDSASSEEKPPSKRTKHRGRNIAQSQTKPENTQRQEAIRKMIEEELMLYPLDDKDWGGRLPKIFREKYSQLDQLTGGKESVTDIDGDASTVSDNDDLVRAPKGVIKKARRGGKRTHDIQAAEKSAISGNDSTVDKKPAAQDEASSGDAGVLSRGLVQAKKFLNQITDPLADEHSENKLSNNENKDVRRGPGMRKPKLARHEPLSEEAKTDDVGLDSKGGGSQHKSGAWSE